MRLYALAFLLTAIFGFWIFQSVSFYSRQKSSPLHALYGLPRVKTDAASLWRAMVTGDDNSLAKPLKQTYFRLGLGHLFTPSGVHLAVLKPIIRSWPSMRFFYPLLALFSMFCPGLLALGRVAWVKTFHQQTRHLCGFMMVLLLEGYLFSWERSPLSWVCSWLFLGLTIFAPRSLLWAWYLVAQMLLCWIWHQPFSWLALPANAILGTFLALFFPFLILGSFLPPTPLHSLLLSILDCWHNLVLKMDSLHRIVPGWYPHAGHIIIGALLLSGGRRHRRWSIALSLLMLSSPTGPWEKLNQSAPRWLATPAAHAFPKSIHSIQGKTLIHWSDGTKCRAILRIGTWDEKCRARKARH